MVCILLAIGLVVATGAAGPAQFSAIAVLVAMTAYGTFSQLARNRPRLGPAIAYLTLCADLAVLVALETGTFLPLPLRPVGLATQLIIAALFAALFPRPIAVLPSLLAFPTALGLSPLWGRAVGPGDLFIVAWLFALNLIVVSVQMVLDRREALAHARVAALEEEVRRMAVATERERLARELHDGLGGALTSLILQAEYLIEQTKDPVALEEARELLATAQDALAELRAHHELLRGEIAFGEKLERYARSFEKRTRISVSFESLGRPEALTPEAGFALYRVLQESLTNAARHARATQVAIRLVEEAGGVSLSVDDNGTGFEPRSTAPDRRGLANMRARAESLGGRFQIRSEPGRGTAVRMSVPLEAPRSP